MTPAPITIDSDTTIPEARALMERYRVRHLPVVERGRVVTMVSERELSVAEVVFSHAEHPSAKRAVRLVGRDDILRLRPDAPLYRAFHDMFEKRIDAAIVENGHRLVGVLSASDACRLLGEQSAVEAGRPAELA